MLGGLEILVNNAGVIDEIDFTKAIDVNVVSRNAFMNTNMSNNTFENRV